MMGGTPRAGAEAIGMQLELMLRHVLHKLDEVESKQIKHAQALDLIVNQLHISSGTVRVPI